MKYKVGDKVRIKNLYWYKENKDEYGSIYAGNGFCFWKSMARHCGEIMKITIVKVDPEDSNKGYYFMENSEERWTDEMIEGLVEENINFDVVVKETTKDISDKVVDTIMGGLMVGKSFNLPDGYIFKDENGNVINATKIVLKKKKKEYPKTYEECCKKLNIAVRDLDILDNMLDTTEIVYCKNLDRLLNAFRKLLICRDAYWKLAGEEMGLGKPWKPDYDSGVDKFGIICLNGIIQESDPTAYWVRHLNKVLDFPTEEMRDAFYENFKELIEQCKKLMM